MYALDLVWSRRRLVPLLSAASARHCGGGAQASCRVVCYVLLVCSLFISNRSERKEGCLIGRLDSG